MIKKKFCLLIAMVYLLFGSCQTQDKVLENSCQLSQNVYANYTIIKGDSITDFFANSSDSCNLLLLDSVVHYFIKNSDEKGFNMLENISTKTDGYLSEYLVEDIKEIYRIRFINLFNFLYESHKRGNKNNLEELLVNSWSISVSESSDPVLELNTLKANAIKSIMSEEEYSQSKLGYLNILLSSINSKEFE